jgi:hypothetical protein
VPVESQIRGWVLDEHWTAPTLQATQAPFRHTGLPPVHGVPLLIHPVPVALHCCG